MRRRSSYEASVQLEGFDGAKDRGGLDLYGWHQSLVTTIEGYSHRVVGKSIGSNKANHSRKRKKHCFVDVILIYHWMHLSSSLLLLLLKLN